MEIPQPYRRKVFIRVKDGFPIVGDSPPSSNIVSKLGAREMYGGVGFPHCGADRYLNRSLHQNIAPNFSVANILLPEIYMRTFTPNGQLLIAFDSTVTKVKVYKFLGPNAANHLFQTGARRNWFGESCIAAEDIDVSASEVRNNIFSSFFEFLFELPVAPLEKQLNRESSLITEDSRFLIVGSTSFSPTFGDVDLDEFGLPTKPCSFDICISVVDLKFGNVVSLSQAII
jgi:de-etiolated-1